MNVHKTNDDLGVSILVWGAAGTRGKRHRPSPAPTLVERVWRARTAPLPSVQLCPGHLNDELYTMKRGLQIMVMCPRGRPVAGGGAAGRLRGAASRLRSS